MATLRSILAVLAGIVTLTIASFAIEAVADPLMIRLFPHALPNASAIAFNPLAGLVTMLYTSLCVAAGGYVTAWLARRAPVQHAVMMGAVEVALTVAAMLRFGKMAPMRSWIATIILTIPFAWLGGALRARQTPSRPSMSF